MFKRGVAASGDFSAAERNFYLIGMLGQNIIITLVSTAISMFYTDVLFIDVVAVGIIMMVAQVWDAINDPMMGMIVDRTRTKRGKCIPYLRIIPILIFIMTVVIFCPVTGFSMGGRIAYAAITYVVWTMVYTVGDIPLWTLCSLVTKDERKRTGLISAARVVGSLAIIISLVFFDIKNVFGKIDLGWFPHTGLQGYEGYFSNPQGYFLSAIVLSFIGTCMFMLVGYTVHERVDIDYENEPKESIKDNLKTMSQNKPFIRLVISGILGSTRMVITISGVYFCKWVLGSGNDGMWFALLGGAFMVGLLVSMGLSPMIARKIGKKKLYIWSSYLSAIPYLVLFFVGYNYVWLILTVMLISGFMEGFVMVLQTAMVADSVDYMEYKTNKRNDAIYFSGMTFISKLTTGITVLITNLILGGVAYTKIITELSDKMANGTLPTDFNFASTYPEVAQALFILITIVPAVGCILEAFPMHGYEFDDDDYNKMMVELNERRSQEKALEEEN